MTFTIQCFQAKFKRLDVFTSVYAIGIYTLILENHVKLFQKQYNSLIKKLFLKCKKSKALKWEMGMGVGGRGGRV